MPTMIFTFLLHFLCITLSPPSSPLLFCSLLAQSCSQSQSSYLAKHQFCHLIDIRHICQIHNMKHFNFLIKTHIAVCVCTVCHPVSRCRIQKSLCDSILWCCGFQQEATASNSYISYSIVTLHSHFKWVCVCVSNMIFRLKPFAIQEQTILPISLEHHH